MHIRLADHLPPYCRARRVAQAALVDAALDMLSYPTAFCRDDSNLSRIVCRWAVFLACIMWKMSLTRIRARPEFGLLVGVSVGTWCATASPIAPSPNTIREMKIVNSALRILGIYEKSCMVEVMWRSCFPPAALPGTEMGSSIVYLVPRRCG
jgi:hypothetical protein